MAEPDLKFAFGLKPKEAIEFFRRKGFNLTWDWEDQVGETHNIAFTVAKVLVLDVLQTIKDAVAKALAEGQSEESFRRDLEPMLKQKGWWGRQTEIVNGEEQQVQLGSPRRLKTIFRTNLQNAMMAGRQQQFEQNTDARPHWQYVAVLDSRTRPMHRKLHDAIYRFDDPFWEYYRPPLAFNCFPEGEVVECSPLLGSKAWYSGQIFKLQTSGGRRLAVTANHPVLTDRGFVPAHQLKKGDNLICAGAKIEGFVSRAINDQYRQARVEQIFDSLAAHGTRRLQPANLDFYGDGEFLQGKIDVVAANRFLCNKFNALEAQLLGEQNFISVLNGRDLLAPGFGEQHRLSVPCESMQFEALQDKTSVKAQLLSNSITTHPRFVEEVNFGPVRCNSLLEFLSPSGGNYATNSQSLLFRGGNSPLPLDFLLLALGSESDILDREHSVDRISAAFVNLRQLQNAMSREIFLDDICVIQSDYFSGHVYDFTTSDGMIISDSIITSNCRCRLRALSPRNIEQRGLTVESSEGRLGTRKQLLSRRSGIEVDVPVLDGEISPDPGFAYSKRQPWAPDLSKYDPELAAQYRKAAEEQGR